MIFITSVILSAVVFFGSVSGVQAAVLPAGFTETRIVTGLTQPTAMEFAPDGRLFVLEQGGTVRIINNLNSNIPQLLPTPFLSLSVNSQNERGLLGIAFDPQFATNQFIYLYYTVPSPVHNRVSRFIATGDTAQLGSEEVIQELEPLSATNHNGGGIHFGTDGKLYIGVGENAQSANAQNLGNLLGKILRIDPDGSVPEDNPFVGQTGSKGEIWAYGLRNPFTFAVNPADGTIFLNDVGQSTFEEINILEKGANYGWPTCEGSCSNTQYKQPIHQYGRTVGRAITGGTFLQGKYYFGDYTATWIKTLDPSTNQVTDFATGVDNVVDLKAGPDGALYSLAIQSGNVYRYHNDVMPSLMPSPGSTLVTVVPVPGSGCTLKNQGDANCDGHVNLIDYDYYRRTVLLDPSIPTAVSADFNGDGEVGVLDGQILLPLFG